VISFDNQAVYVRLFIHLYVSISACWCKYLY